MNRNELLYIRLSFFISVLICAAKFIAWLYTHSLVIFSDALESVINVAGAAFAWYSIYLAGKPRDEDHPYGHGKIEFFSVGFEGGMIFIAGISILIQAILFFIHPKQVEQLQAGIWLSVAAGAANFLLGYFLLMKGKQRNSITLQGNGHHILSDGYTSLGVIVALLLILFTGVKWIDPLASVVAGSLLIYTGSKLVRRAIRGLMDEVDVNVIDDIITILKENRKNNWIDVHNLRAQRYGNNYHVDCHVTLPYYFLLEQVHDEIKRMDEALNSNFKKGSIEFFIHTDPCLEVSCGHCLIADCAVRKKAFVKKIEWSRDNLLPNKKHEYSD
ncbi:MAG: cation diffusion facilitator family transporter [Chitinophagaceae bacterium]|nr:cation diffusion facilitator family transporter [Chitinophagaceae bacterium]